MTEEKSSEKYAREVLGLNVEFFKSKLEERLIKLEKGELPDQSVDNLVRILTYDNFIGEIAREHYNKVIKDIRKRSYNPVLAKVTA